MIASDRNGSDLGFASVPLSFAADATAPPATPTAVEPRFTANGCRLVVVRGWVLSGFRVSTFIGCIC